MQWLVNARRLAAAVSPAGSAASASSAAPWIADVDGAWIPQLGISFHLAVDGLSLLLLVLTFAPRRGRRARVVDAASASASASSTSTCCGPWPARAGVFLALDLFLFYFFWELMLVPMYFLIALWGHERRVYAAIKFFLFTQVSGLLMLVAILALAFVHQRATGVFTFDFTAAAAARRCRRAPAIWLMLGFFVAFAVKLPAVPAAHLAARRAHRGAHRRQRDPGRPAAQDRRLRPASASWCRSSRRRPSTSAPSAMALGVVGILYGAVLAFGQRDLKRLVAYTSVSHMGFVLLGVFAWNALALQGALLEIVCHGFSTGALFVLVGALQERIHTRDMAQMGGLWTVAPRMGGAALFFALASLGLPGLGNFVAEFLILLGTWQVSRWAAVLGAVGLVFATVYALWMVQRAFHGEETHGWSFADLRRARAGRLRRHDRGPRRARLLPAARDRHGAAGRGRSAGGPPRSRRRRRHRPRPPAPRTARPRSRPSPRRPEPPRPSPRPRPRNDRG